MKAAFFDVDGTLTENRVWSGFLDYFRVHKLRRWTNYAFNVYHYGLYGLCRLGLISQAAFRSPWAEHLSWYLKDYSLEQTAEIWDWVVKERISKMWRNEIRLLLDDHRVEGDVVFLVSGGPTGLLERIAEEVGADHVVGTRHEVVDGFYTGKAESAGCQGLNKAMFAKNKIAELWLEINLDESYAYADSMADIYLLEMVGKPAAVYPDAELREVAEDRRWKILGE